MSKELAFVLTAVALITGATGAAADEYIPPPRARPAAPPATAPPPLYNWAGPNVGVAGGFAWGRSNQTDAGFFIPPGGGGGVPPADGSFSMKGGLIGGGGGYNLQFGQWVLGLETDYSWADIKGSSNGCGAAFISHICSTELRTRSERSEVALAMHLARRERGLPMPLVASRLATWRHQIRCSMRQAASFEQAGR